MGAPTDGLRAWALINGAALRANARSIRELVGPSQVYAVVKANAYGHTLEHVVGEINHLVDGFAVATLEEGLCVRALAPYAAVIVLSEFNAPSQIDILRAGELQAVVHRAEQVDWLEETPPLPTPVWLKIDSGMNRLGVAPGQAGTLFDRLSAAGNRVSLMSHMASADEPDGQQNESQIAVFEQVMSARDGSDHARSLANSAALDALPATRLDLVRPGLVMYGISPFGPEFGPGSTLDLQPVMQLEARLIAVKRVSAGDRVGYGGTWTCERGGQIGIVSFGYADGYPRGVGADAYAIVNGSAAPLAGRVSMDMLTLDLTDCPGVSVGDVVQLWGGDIGVERVARWANTIPYELLCRVAPRVPRFLI